MSSDHQTEHLSDGTGRECPECGSNNWSVYDSVPAEYTNEPGVRCRECGMIGTGGGFDDDIWMWGWP